MAFSVKLFTSAVQLSVTENVLEHLKMGRYLSVAVVSTLLLNFVDGC